MTMAPTGSWLRRELAVGRDRLRDRRRVAAIIVIGLTGGFIATFLLARGELSGADAGAYWAGVRLWLAGGDAYHPPGPYLPYVYAPWTLVLFVPWALLPWEVAWFLLRGVNVILLAWTFHWAYQRRPVAAAVAFALLGAPIATTLDTGNITLLVALVVWAVHFVGPRVGGLLWALATALKWFPSLFLFILVPRTRLWGMGWLTVGGILLLATWPETLVHIDLALNFPRPLRLDYVLLAWGAVPWLWHQERFWRLDRTQLRAAAASVRRRVAQRWRDVRGANEPVREAGRLLEAGLRAFFGVS